MNSSPSPDEGRRIADTSAASAAAENAARLAALYRYRILETPPEGELDDFTRLAAQICATPLALISLVDHDRQWFKSAFGTDLCETSLDRSICKHVVARDELLVVPDMTLDERLESNPLVTGEPHLRFYAGAPLKTPEGHVLGALCVLDHEPRELGAEQLGALSTLARKVMNTLDLRLSRELLSDTVKRISDAFLIIDPDLRIVHFNDEARRLFPVDGSDLHGATIDEACDFEGGGELRDGIRGSVADDQLREFEFHHAASDRWFAVRVYPGDRGVTVSARDITARRAAETRLRLLEHSFAHIHDAVIITEAEPIDFPGPRIVYVNDAFARHTGYSREEVLGKTPRILQGPDTQRDALDRIRAAMLARRPVREELINYTKAGEPFWLEIEIAPVTSPSGGPEHLIAVQRDITERKRREVERHELVRTLGERVKELTAIHRVAALLHEDLREPESLLDRIAALIPPAMQYPEIAGARVEFGTWNASTPRFTPRARWSMTAPFTTRCGVDGAVKVVYRARRPEIDEGPFMKEERKLIESLAEMLGAHFERRLATASLRASEERFRRMFEDAVAGIVVTTLDTRILQINPAFSEMLGYPASELVGRPLRTFNWPEDWAENRCLINELNQGDRDSFVIEKRYRHRSGRVVWARLSVSAIRPEDESEELRLIGVAEHITARKQAEMSLATSERRFRELAESMPIVVWTATAEGEVDYANHVFYDQTGASPDDEIGKIWLRYLHPADRELCLAAWRDVIKTGEIFEIEYRVHSHAEDEYRWTRVQAQPIRDDDGRITRWFGTGIDIHQTRRLQEKAFQLARSLTNTLESLTDAFLTIDRNWQVTYLNAEAERQLGIARDHLNGRHLMDELGDKAGPVLREELERAMVENVTVSFEEFAPGLEQWFDIRAYPSVEGLAVYLRNITEAHLNHEAIAISEERFRLLAQATDDAIWDWDLVSDSVWWNEGLAQLFGDAPGEGPANGDDWTARIHPEDRERIVRETDAAIAGDARSWSGEYRFRRKDGLYAHVFDRGTLIRDANGIARRMIGGMSDITERKESEKKLREQATLLDKAQDAILVRDLDHRILYWNQSAERLYGWTAGEALGRSIETLLYKDPAAFRAATNTTLEEGEWLGELQQISRDGRTLTVEGRWSLVCDDKGRPRSILAINTDITERKLLEQQFLRAQRLESIGTLAGGIAHDLNNVLAPILMSIDLLKSVVSEPDAHEILHSVETSAKRGADMVKQVLSFARGAEGRRIDVQPRHLIDDIVRISRDTFPKTIRIESKTDHDLWTLSADPTQLHQVLLNLCVNARDAMPEGGRLRIRAANIAIDSHEAAMHLEASPGPHVRLEVADEGHGIPASTLERIFDPFFTTKEVGQGTGLGLSTTLAIVRGHKGFIRVDSEPGEGTRFTIHFPARPDAGGGTGSDPAEGAMPRGRGETVLVVDDEQSVREVTRRTLEVHGYKVFVAADGAEGFSTFVKERNSIRVILTDLLMPVMDGLTMIKALRRLDSDLPVIAASGFSPEDKSLEASHPDIACFLAKPYTAECLLNAIRRALGPDRRS